MGVIDQVLRSHVEQRLDAESLELPLRALVLAACDGDPALAARLSARPALEAPPPTDPTDARATEVWLVSLTVEGFRGVAAPLTLTLDPGPGLVVVAGRNGSGKSSLAEGLEVLLTGVSHRWQGRAKTFATGWSNVHHEGTRRVTATFVVAGRAHPLVIERRWTGDDQGQSELRVDGILVPDLHPFGGRDAIQAWRPVLSCGELGRKLEDSPSALFDAIAGVLGLEALTDARDRLRKQSRDRKELARRAKQDLLTLRSDLAQGTDPRAVRCRELLAPPEPDLGALSAVDEPADEVDARALAHLQRTAATRVPQDDEAAAAVAAVRAAADQIDTLVGTAAARGEKLLVLLQSALALHDDGAVDCPVCGAQGALGGGWADHARAEVDRARTGAAALRDARAQGRQAEQRLAELAPGLVSDDLTGRALADRVERGWPRYRDGMVAARDHAAAELARRQAAWLPLAARIRSWVELKRSADVAARQANMLDRAEEWLGEAEVELRAERFAPIRDEALRIWSTLRQDSSVELGEVAMSGGRTRRHLELSVRVDGVEAEAQGVMSQGELNALALSLFVPRTVLADSPFRFVVVDDPVQAMDPHKVDGLARVFGELAKARQTVVLTHDERLLESLRRQRIPATVLGVHRRARSQVELAVQKDPVQQHLDDAHRVLSAQSTVSDVVVARLVPGFCREALEAALVERVRRERLGRGERHADVEALLAGNSLRSLAALALFDEPKRGEEVEDELVRRSDGTARTLFGELNRGAHGEGSLAPKLVYRYTTRLVEALGQEATPAGPVAGEGGTAAPGQGR